MCDEMVPGDSFAGDVCQACADPAPKPGPVASARGFLYRRHAQRTHHNTPSCLAEGHG